MKKVILSLLGIGSLLFLFIWVFIGKRPNKILVGDAINKEKYILDSIYQAEKFDTNRIYEPLSLNFNGKPIFSIGEKLKEVDSTLTYRIDPNSDYQDYFPLIRDYLITEDKLSLYKIGKYSYVTAMVYFSAEGKSNRIFNVSGCWGFQVYDPLILDKMETWFTENLFPELKDKFEFRNHWNYKIETQNQVELFDLIKKDESWVLNYRVKLK
ncbi:hypothetical protein [Tenacibaculum xiamenense]|uniref:hypothetical protein n=1 Tax=Tenacibaculum xiamenense TaxID=1261553 RepID=UPI0038B425A6